MSEIKNGDTIKVHIEGKTTKGFSFSTKQDGAPVQIIVGEGSVIPAVEKAVLGMKQGEVKELTVAPEDSLPRDENLVMKLNKEQLPDQNMELNIGQILVLGNEEGAQAQAMVVEIEEDTFTIDANPPIAGEGISLVIEIVELVA